MTPREANADLLAEIAALRNRVASLTRENAELQGVLAQATNREAATSEILRVISSSPTDVQPVFDTIVQSAVRLCDGVFSALFRFDGELMHQVAQHNYTPEALETAQRIFPARPTRALRAARAILDRAVVHVPDAELDAEFQDPALGRAIGYRSVLSVPMIREGAPIGVISVGRATPGPFSDKQIALLQTFADQAVIAIENVRLFTELQEKNTALTQAHAQVSESLEQQTATTEILRVISSSPTDTQPVFDAIARNAVALCGGIAALVLRYDGEMLHIAGHHEMSPDAVERVERAFPRRPGRDYPPGRALLERQVVHIPDLQAATEFTSSTARQRGVGSMLVVPLLREGEAIGVISLARAIVEPFSAQQIEVLETFADQAVIAIENVRLFKELEVRNSDLTESLKQQTAASEILRVISNSPTDVQPVFDAIIKNAVELCGGVLGTVFRFDGEQLHLAAHSNVTSEGIQAFREVYPMPVSRDTVAGCAILDRRAIQAPDCQAEGTVPWRSAAMARAAGFRGVVAVPMLQAGAPIGLIAIGRRESGLFSDGEIMLLKTFADQAVIAIENVRLFKELETRNRELTQALDRETATGEILRVINSSPTSAEPVFDAILANGMRLCQADVGLLFLVEGDTFQLVADRGASPEFVEPRRTAHRSGPHTGIARAVQERRPIHIEDLLMDRAYIERDPARLQTIELLGARSGVWVPLLKEDMAIGVLVTWRREVRRFTDAEIEVLTTFANQAVIAIENVRLLRDLDEKSRQLEVASQHKSEFLANMSHELRTPLNAIIGFSEVLSERMFGELNEKQEEYSKDIHASGQHLLSLINDILDLSKIEAGRMELELSDFHLPTALDSALTLVRERAGRRSIALHLSVDERLGQIQADERKVRQVVLNLLSNAIKFTPEGGRIEVRAVPVNGSVEVSVRDTGVGIAPEDQEAVFEEFRQVGTADKKVEGTGLGLTLCRKFVELHGGRIWVKSQVGVGSTFAFTLPVRRD